MWYQKFDTFIRGIGFTRSKADHYVYFKLICDCVIYLVLYVDDMLLVGNDKEIIQDLKTQLSSKFDMKDLGATNYILSMEIKRDRAKRKLWLNQRKYVETILQRFNMQDSKPVKVPIPVGVRLYFVRDMIEDKKVLLVKVDTLKNTANALTKPMSSKKFSWCRETMGIAGLDK